MIRHEQDLHGIICELGLQIAIDGPAGAGKSTVGRNLARALGCHHVDTGLMYRAVALRALEEEIAPSDAEKLAALAREIRFELSPEPAGGLLIDGKPPSRVLHTPAVDELVSPVSAHAPVRGAMLARQRELAGADCIVMMGRDIGTTVLPDAAVKLWITASPEERASRRRTERHSTDQRPTADEMRGRIARRDSWDADREVSPLRQAPDAVVIDTGSCTPRETLEKALDAVRAAVSSDTRRTTRRRRDRPTPPA